MSLRVFREVTTIDTKRKSLTQSQQRPRKVPTRFEPEGNSNQFSNQAILDHHRIEPVNTPPGVPILHRGTRIAYFFDHGDR